MTDADPAAALHHEHLQTMRTGRVAVRGPAQRGDARELWIALHGYGELAADVVAGLRAIDDGTRLIVAPEALSRFYDVREPTDRHAEARVGASWMTREDRLHEIADQLRWLDVVLATYRGQVAAGAPLVVLGFSQGAAAASRWVSQQAIEVSHLICWGASLAPELPIGPGSVLARTRCTIVIGDRDKFVPESRVVAECQRMDAAGFPYVLERFAGGHRLDDATLARIASRIE